MGTKEYTIKAGFGAYASDEIIEMNPEVPDHNREGAHAVWITKGRFSNTGIISDGYKDGISGVYLWYSSSTNFEADAIRKNDEYLAMMDKFLDLVDLKEDGIYEVAVKDLFKGTLKKGIINKIDYVATKPEELDVVVVEDAQ